MDPDDGRRNAVVTVSVMSRRLLVSSAAVLALTVSACGGDGQEPVPAAPPAATSAGPSTPASSSPPASSSASASPSSGAVDLYDKDFAVSWQDALKKAQGDFTGDVSKIELEQSDTGRYEYKVELLSDTQKYAAQYDAESGDEVSKKTDDLDKEDVKTERREKRVDLNDVVSLKDAMDAARGAQAGAINKWKIEGKSSGAQYEFDIDDDSDGDADNDYEVQVDAKSGKVTSSGR